jgi:branched-chain amino acid transport system substrate-binding protein
LRDGAALAVERANAAGGVAGRRLQLVVLDDAGNSHRAASNAHVLVQRGVIALTGVHGARATAAVASILAQGGAPPIVGPAAGADSLREPPRPNVFFLRASISEEVSSAILHLDTLGISRYAVVAQADPFGESGLEGVLNELTRFAVRPIASERISSAAEPAEVQASLAGAAPARQTLPAMLVTQVVPHPAIG